MPVGMPFHGICRKISAAPELVTSTILLRPEYGTGSEDVHILSPTIVHFVKLDLWLHCSHSIVAGETFLFFVVPSGQEGWAMLIDQDQANEEDFQNALERSLHQWEVLFKELGYEGPYEKHVRDSISVLQQLVYEPNGAILAAATTSLPEQNGGEQNYDYRYVWMRDSTLFTNALVQLKAQVRLNMVFCPS